MNKVFLFLKRIVSIHKYPWYFEYFVTNYILQFIWRMQGVVLDKGIVWLGTPILKMVKGSTISIGKGCLICSRSDQTVLGVNHPVILRTICSDSQLRIGEGVRMSGTTICVAEKVIIGNRCVIGANVTIVDTDFHSLEPSVRSSYSDGRLAIHNSVEIGDDVFIGGGAFILKGVKIGSSSVIGAGSVVTRDVPDFAKVAGNPAKLIGRIKTIQLEDTE